MGVKASHWGGKTKTKKKEGGKKKKGGQARGRGSIGKLKGRLDVYFGRLHDSKRNKHKEAGSPGRKKPRKGGGEIT